ncbi:hypothetical protein IC620_15975 [Hazenella sp. IB182357]|uniref:Uncharacterized protein n=1 Tax=Polycladospora coralii TaxID=2771432 RepID=A0A926RV65_9BACL|nr:hypothetical protein [Polycladospora coralii]MBD1373843.1 hypothetical protein [Polycladospora coralii]
MYELMDFFIIKAALLANMIWTVTTAVVLIYFVFVLMSLLIRPFTGGMKNE